MRAFLLVSPEGCLIADETATPCRVLIPGSPTWIDTVPGALLTVWGDAATLLASGACPVGAACGGNGPCLGEVAQDNPFGKNIAVDG